MKRLLICVVMLAQTTLGLIVHAQTVTALPLTESYEDDNLSFQYPAEWVIAPHPYADSIYLLSEEFEPRAFTPPDGAIRLFVDRYTTGSALRYAGLSPLEILQAYAISNPILGVSHAVRDLPLSNGATAAILETSIAGENVFADHSIIVRYDPATLINLTLTIQPQTWEQFETTLMAVLETLQPTLHEPLASHADIPLPDTFLEGSAQSLANTFTPAIATMPALAYPAGWIIDDRSESLLPNLEIYNSQSAYDNGFTFPRPAGQLKAVLYHALVLEFFQLTIEQDDLFDLVYKFVVTQVHGETTLLDPILLTDEIAVIGGMEDDDYRIAFAVRHAEKIYFLTAQLNPIDLEEFIPALYALLQTLQ